MSENTGTERGKKRRGNKKLTEPTEPCLAASENKQIVIGVVGGGGPLGGVSVRVLDSKKKKSESVTDSSGLIIAEGLREGPCSVEVRLNSKQKTQYLVPEKLVSQLKQSDPPVEVIRLESCSTEVQAVVTCAQPERVFDPIKTRGETIRVQISLDCNAAALAMVKLSLQRRGPPAEVFTDPEMLTPLVFLRNVAQISNDRFADGAFFNLWVTSADQAPTDLVFCVDQDPPEKLKKGQKVPTPSQRQVSVKWHEAVVTPAIPTVATYEIGTPFIATCSVSDPDRVTRTSKVSILDKDDAEAWVFADPQALGGETTIAWTINWDGVVPEDQSFSLLKAPYQIQLETTDKFGAKKSVKKPLKVVPQQSVISLKFNDPDGVARPLPKDFPVLVKFDDGSSDALKIGENGLLLETTGKPLLELNPKRQGFTFSFPKSTSYIVVERKSGIDTPVLWQALVPAGEITPWIDSVEPTKQGCRAFLLPADDWGLADSVWTITGDDDARFDAATGKFSADAKSIGSKDAPAVLLLDPRWQFARITYQDRFRGGAAQVSSLPLFLEGLGKRPTAPTDLPATRSNWTIGGAKSEDAIQCLPWIVRSKDPLLLAPTKASELRFKTDAHSYIETPADTDKPRAWAKGTAKEDASAERMRFYDLPAEWRSHNWFVRSGPTGPSTGAFFGTLDSTAKVLGTKSAPLIFSLDDLVLYDCPDPSKPNDIVPLAALDALHPVSVFHYSFATGTDLSPEGVYLFTDAPTAKGSLAKIEDVRYPVSKDDVVMRAGPSHQENYVCRYADWSRLVAVEGSLFDVFAARSTALDTAPDRVVGARAAVRINDPLAARVGVTPTGGTAGTHPPKPDAKVAPRSKAVKSRYLTIQSLVEFDGPHPNVRFDYNTLDTQGTLSPEKTDFAAHYGRAKSSVAEATSDTVLTGNARVGRFDAVLLRCCGVDPNDAKRERMVQFNYFRVTSHFETTCTVNTTDALKGVWIDKLVKGVNQRWNGPDGGFNPGRVFFEAIEKSERKFTIEVVRFLQHLPDERAAIRFKVVPASNARDYMASHTGITESQEGNEAPTTDGWFTAAHEMGHGGGLFDDYCEVANHASYGQPGILMLMPGDPYVLDDTPGFESMMMRNRVVRPRHFWHMAEWVHAQLTDEIKLQIVRAGETTAYSLPHHRQSRTPDPTVYRTFLQLPWAAAFDNEGATTTEKARYDSYLYVLGNELYTKQILPNRTGDQSSESYDGILIVTLAMLVNYSNIVDYALIENLTGKVVTAVRAAFSDRVVASFDSHGRKFERCMIVISPRVMVGTHSNDDGYHGRIGLGSDDKVTSLAPAWAAASPFRGGDQVRPSVGNGFIYKYNVTPGTGKLTGIAEPTWPKTKGERVVDNQVTWTAVPIAEARKPQYEALVASKLGCFPPHVNVEVGAATSEVAVLPTALPRFRITSSNTDLRRDPLTLASLVASVQEANWQPTEDERARLRVCYDTAGTEKTQLDNEWTTLDTELTRRDGLYNSKEIELNNAKAAKKLPGGNTKPAKRLVRRLEQELSDLADEFNIQVGLCDAKAEEIRLKVVEKDGYSTNHNDQLAARDAIKPAEQVKVALIKLRDLANGLFTPATNPLVDTAYDELIRDLGEVRKEARTRTATWTSTIAKMVSTKAAVVQAKGLLQIISKSAKPAQLGTVAQAIIDTANAIKKFAAGGVDDPEKKQRIRDARGVIVDLAAKASTLCTEEYNALWLMPGWDTASTTALENISLAHRIVVKPMLQKLKLFVIAEGEATFEEQIVNHVGSWLGVDKRADSVTGFERLIQSVNGGGTVHQVTIPRPPPAPILVPPTNAPVLPPPPTDTRPLHAQLQAKLEERQRKKAVVVEESD